MSETMPPDEVVEALNEYFNLNVDALATLSAISGAAFAQSSVTLYGVFDTGFQSNKLTVGSDSYKQTAAVQGGMSGNRIGFKGEEDLGGGMKASFTVEMGIDPTESSLDNTTTGLANRQSFVGVSGGFGAVTIGRQYTVHHSNQGAGDMVGNLNGQTGYLGAMDSLVRASNLLVHPKDAPQTHTPRRSPRTYSPAADLSNSHTAQGRSGRSSRYQKGQPRSQANCADTPPRTGFPPTPLTRENAQAAIRRPLPKALHKPQAEHQNACAHSGSPKADIAS